MKIFALPLAALVIVTTTAGTSIAATQPDLEEIVFYVA